MSARNEGPIIRKNRQKLVASSLTVPFKLNLPAPHARTAALSLDITSATEGLDP